MKSNLPEGWEEVKLSEVIELTMGQSPKSEFYNEEGVGMPFMQGNTTFGRKYPTIERYTTKITRLAKENDVLMSVRAPVGDLNICNIKEVCIGRGLCSIRMKNNMQEFIYYLMEYNMRKLRSRESGTVFSSINKRDLESLPINLPSLKEQESIANTLSSLDDKIELNNKINENLEEQAQAIFKHWFIDFEFPDENGNPYKSSGGEMIESELGRIPKGWEVKELGDIIKISNGKRPRAKYEEKNQESKYPILGASGVMGYTNEFLYNEPILVIGRVGTHGVVQKTNNKVWTSDNTMVIKSDYYELVNVVLLNMDYKSLNRGSTQPLLAQKDIKSQKISLGPEKIIQKFESVIGSFNNKINGSYQQNQVLSQLRDTLLPKLMSGEIRMPQTNS